MPDLRGRTADVAQQNLTVYGFTRTTQVPVDNPAPAGQIVGTTPPAGSNVPLDTVIELQISRGNQFVMPDLTGRFWVDAEPLLRALGWTGSLDKGNDVSNSGQKTNAVVTQNPPAGAGVNFGANIYATFAS